MPKEEGNNNIIKNENEIIDEYEDDLSKGDPFLHKSYISNMNMSEYQRYENTFEVLVCIKKFIFCLYLSSGLSL